METRAGLILQAIRDDQNRARYLGFDVPVYQVFFFTVSAAISGIAGMLYVIVAEFASPTFMDLSFSITMVVWAALGGRSSLLGACIGAILINIIAATVSETEMFVEAWKAIIGLVFVLVVLYLPRGLAGFGQDLADALANRLRTPRKACRDGRVAPGRERHAMTVALTIDGIGVSFAGVKAVDGVSLLIEEGELRVLLGANGAGKTTLMDLISGKTPSTEGRVFLFDTEITNWSPHRIARAGIGRKFQIPSVFRDFTVRRNLDVASCSDPRVLANLGIGIPRARRRRINEVLELTGLADAAETPAANLSHGQTQWLELGMLIVQDPKLLLLDEPTAGMTQAETHKTAEIIKGLRGQHTILVVEHDMAFVREIAEQITVMHLGRVLAEGDIAAIESNEAVRRAYLGSHGISGKAA